MVNKRSIVYLGCSGFPYGLAEIKKLTLISKGLIMAGNSVTVICKKGIYKYSAHPGLHPSGNSEGINYVYTSGSPFRDDRFITRNLLKVKGKINELILIYKLRKDKKLDYAILSTHSFYDILYYVILSKLFRFKTILNHVEFYSGVKMKWSQKSKWLNDELYDHYAPKLVDVSFPISEFLINHLNKIAPALKYFKVPILAEFEKYDDTEILQEPFYFLFSGSAAYFEIVKFIIDSFNLIENSEAHLYLAIKGEEQELKRILEYLNYNPRKDAIKLFSKLTDKQLYNYYKNAKALLIPLRPILQDEARFPHKVGEYLASGNPVISTNYGEIKYYFRDQETMLIADSYEVNEFASKMQYVVDFPDKSKKIGEKGKDVALENFNYTTYGEKINNFLDSTLPN